MVRGRALFLALSNSERMRRLATETAPAQAVSRRFVAGEKRAEAVSLVQRLNLEGLLGTLDYLGENTASEMEARDSAAEVLDLLGDIETAGAEAGVSIKLTQLGLDLSPALATENARAVADRAAEFGRFVRIDMESSEYVQPTLDLFEELRRSHKNVGVVIQSYLYRSAEDVARLVELGASVRLVKGAYDEPARIAYSDKAETDASYLRLAEQLLGDRARSLGVYPAIATHDVALIDWVREHTGRYRISSDQFEFQMLYGIRRRLQHELIAQGYRVRVYIPYGENWYPYFMRRLAERPANLAFVLRSLLRP
jgi:proline dehydrogenase